MKIRQLVENPEDIQSKVISELKRLSDSGAIELFMGTVRFFENSDTIPNNVTIMVNGNDFGLSLKNRSFGNAIYLNIIDDVDKFDYQLDSDLSDRLIVRVTAPVTSIRKLSNDTYKLLPKNLVNNDFNKWDKRLSFKRVGIDLSKLVNDMNITGELDAQYCEIYCERPLSHTLTDVNFNVASFKNSSGQLDITSLLNIKSESFYAFYLQNIAGDQIYPNIIKLASSDIILDIELNNRHDDKSDMNKILHILKKNYMNNHETMNTRQLHMSAVKLLSDNGYGDLL